MPKAENKERKKTGKVSSSKAESPSANDLSPEAKIKKVMELTKCTEAVAEKALIGCNDDLDGAVLAVMDHKKEDSDSWQESGKVRKSKKQNDAEKEKYTGRGTHRGKASANRELNEARGANLRTARDTIGPRQPTNASVNVRGRNVQLRQNKKLNDNKSPIAELPIADLKSKDEDPNWRNGPLVFEKTVPPTVSSIQISASLKSDKPTFAEIAAKKHKKTVEPIYVEPKLSLFHIEELQLNSHHETLLSGVDHEQSNIHSVAAKSPPSVSCNSVPLETYVNHDFTEKLKNDIGLQTSDQISGLALSTRVKSMQEDGEFFESSDSKLDQFYSLEEMPAVEDEKSKKINKPLMLSYINPTVVDCPSKKAMDISKVDKQTQVVMEPIVQSQSDQQPPSAQNLPMEYQQLSHVQQQIVTAVAAQLAQSFQFNPMMPRETQASIQNMQVPVNVHEISQPVHMQGRMVHGQHVIQGQHIMPSHQRVDSREQQNGGTFGWSHQQQAVVSQQVMGSQPGNQIRMYGGVETPPGFLQGYPSQADYQSMHKLQSEHQASTSFANQRSMHNANIPQMQQPNVGMINPTQRSLASHGFPQSYSFGVGVNSGGPQPVPQMAGGYSVMQNFQQQR